MGENFLIEFTIYGKENFNHHEGKVIEALDEIVKDRRNLKHIIERGFTCTITLKDKREI
jgi:hypothetical protein